jgi:phage terminase large subunit-like protein
MPTNNERFSKKSQSSVLAKRVEGTLSSETKILNALDFIESPQGLNTTLYPVQRVIVRCMYGIPFDYKAPIPKYGTIKIWDEFKSNLLAEFDNEEDFLKWAYNEGKCNIPDWRDIPEGGFREACVFAGRRGGKSQLVSAVGAFELYSLLNIRSPQEYYDLKTSDIEFLFLAQDDKGAARLYNKLREDVINTNFFANYLRINTTKEMGFVSEADRNKHDITPTIKVLSVPCTTNAVRGPSTRFLALDEFAHFASKKGASSDEVYSAATPGTSNFVNNLGKNEDMIMCISSPWKKIGKMYDLHKQAMENGIGSGMFTMNIGTSIMNPRITAEKLHKEYTENPLTFKAEFGGQFLDSAESYVRHAAFQVCVDEGRKNTVQIAQKNLGREFFWGLDLGMKNDATALAIGHLEFLPGKGIGLVYDYIDRMILGEDGEWPGVKQELGDRKYSDKTKFTQLPLQDIVSWLIAMQTILPCTSGATDQHGGSQLVQLLQMNGIRNMELLHISPQINSKMFYALKGYIDNNRCRFPDVPKFAYEIGQVEAELITKFTLRVAAPAEKGAHDDMVDAAAIVAFLAQKYLEDHKRILLDPTGATFAMQERMADPMPHIIPDISGVSMRDLQMLERTSRMRKAMALPGQECIRSPWSRAGRGGGRGGRR